MHCANNNVSLYIVFPPWVEMNLVEMVIHRWLDFGQRKVVTESEWKRWDGLRWEKVELEILQEKTYVHSFFLMHLYLWIYLMVYKSGTSVNHSFDGWPQMSPKKFIEIKISLQYIKSFFTTWYELWRVPCFGSLLLPHKSSLSFLFCQFYILLFFVVSIHVTHLNSINELHLIYYTF
jgi:hypothetical protein